jgi:hypothetical protein
MNGSEPSAGNPATPAAARSARQIHLKDWIIRGGVILLITASVAVAWWSLTEVLAPRQKLSEDLSRHVARLSAQVDDLERKRTGDEVAHLNAQFDQVATQLLAGDTALDAWVAKLKDQLNPGGLGVQVDFAPAQPQFTNGARIALIPTTLTLDASAAATATPSTYPRILQLSRQLSTQNPRADLKELTVTAGTNSVNRAILALDLWAGDPTFK